MLLYFVGFLNQYDTRTLTNGTKNLSNQFTTTVFFCVKIYTFNDIDNRLPGGGGEGGGAREMCCIRQSRERERERPREENDRKDVSR